MEFVLLELCLIDYYTLPSGVRAEPPHLQASSCDVTYYQYSNEHQALLAREHCLTGSKVD